MPQVVNAAGKQQMVTTIARSSFLVRFVKAHTAISSRFAKNKKGNNNPAKPVNQYLPGFR